MCDSSSCCKNDCIDKKKSHEHFFDGQKHTSSQSPPPPKTPEFCGFPKCELGSGVLLPTSHSNGFSAVKVGEGDCRRVLQRNKISSGEKQEDLDGHGNYFELIYFYGFSHSRSIFKESLTIEIRGTSVDRLE